MTTPDDTAQGQETQPQEHAVEPEGTGTQQNAAPWASYLEDLPESVRPLVEPKFREWDASVTQRFQQVHSQYEPFKAYEPLLESGYDVDDIQQALSLAEALNADPEAVFKALQESYGFGQGEQGQTEVGQQPSEDEEYDPRFLQVEQMTNTMAELMAAQYEAQQAEAQDRALEDALTSAKSKHGDFDEGMVLSMMHANPSLDLDSAVTQYNSWLERQVSARQAPVAPVVMGGGGGLPSQAIDPSKLSEQERKSLVTQWLANSNRET